MDRSTNYDFLLMIHSNHGPISYRFREKWQFQSKVANFSHLVYFTPLLRELPLEFCNGGSPEKLRVVSLPDSVKSLTICAFISIQYWHVTHGQVFHNNIALCTHDT